MPRAIDLIEKYWPCLTAVKWLGDMAAEEAWETCERGDWMLWTLQRRHVDIQKLTLAKVRCARLVEHLMIDERSIKALQVAEAFAAGEATREELEIAADAAADATADADAADYVAAYVAYVAAAADVAADAADVAADAADVAADAADVAADVAAADAAVSHAAYRATRQDVLRQAADIVREVIAFGDLGL